MSNGEPVTPLEAASEIGLTSNIGVCIRNPLAGIPHDQLLRDVELFAEEKGLADELPILLRGATRELLLINLSGVRVLT
jgi:hypothetical protein